MPALYFIKAISDTDQKYYPETLNKLYLVNAPSAFVMVWKIVKAWLDPGVSEKRQGCLSCNSIIMLDRPLKRSKSLARISRMFFCNKFRQRIYRAFWVEIVLVLICLVDVFLLKVCVTMQTMLMHCIDSLI